MDELEIDEAKGIKFIWNTLPASRTDSTKIIIPPGFHYSPNAQPDNLQTLEYEPLKCKCGSVISPKFNYSVDSKVWECPFCRNRNYFPQQYSQFISEENLPAELFPENSTVEYILPTKQANPPIFLFLIDTAVEEDELNELKEQIQQTIDNLPQDCQIGLITFGKNCRVIEVGSTDYEVSYALNGEKCYKSSEIQELLGLLVKNKGSEGTFVNPANRPKFIMPVNEVAFFVGSLLDDLEVDGYIKGNEDREKNCCGLAVNVAVSLLEAYGKTECSRVLVFMGGPTTIGGGKIVGTDLKETIRGFVDFTKNNSNTKYYPSACEYYQKIAQIANANGIIIDLFACCLNQVGLLEMQSLVCKTGGYMIFTDSFSTRIFKDSLKKIFNLDENGNLKMNFKAVLTMNITNDYKISGALGHLTSINKKTPQVSDIVIGEGNTCEWILGGINPNSTYTFLLDPNDQGNKKNKMLVVQVLTTYIAGDRTTRLRVSTVKRKIFKTVEKQQDFEEIGKNFDQEAAAVLITRLSLEKRRKGEESVEILRWIDKTLIHLMSKFARYVKDVPTSFKLTDKFSYFPQFMFYLRRSSFIQSFNESPDESTYYKTLVMVENVSNCTVMIQPLLFEYTPEKPEMTPVQLDLKSMKNDCVLFLDTFFYLVVWHGADVVKWREEGFQDQEGYENIKQMLDEPQDYAQKIVDERNPTPKFVSCDFGTGAERLLKCIVNPSNDGKFLTKESGFFSDDVNLKVFMDYLKKLSVSS